MPSLLERVWYPPGSRRLQLLEPALATVSGFYAIGLKVDQALKRAARKRLPRPVFSVGNITVGGTGKTPVTVWLAKSASEMGLNPCILSRGYGSKSSHPRKVDPETSSWWDFGDEPVMMARSLTEGVVYTAASRWEAGCLALEREKEIDLFLLDDGFQHLQLERDVDSVLVDCERGVGNRHLLPWGPLREPVSALARATAVGRVQRGAEQVTSSTDVLADFTLNLAITDWRILGAPARISMDLYPADRPAYLLSGIGSPQSFEKTVIQSGLSIAKHSVYPDHHAFTVSELQQARDEAEKLRARVFTTSKDAVRMEPHKSLWTKESLPVIIELGLKHGDGTEFLTRVLKSLF